MGDPPPDSADGPGVDDAMAIAEDLAATGAIGAKQAQVYVLRELFDVRRSETAELLDQSPNTVDNHLAAARTNVQQARTLVAILEDVPSAEEGHDAP